MLRANTITDYFKFDRYCLILFPKSGNIPIPLSAHLTTQDSIDVLMTSCSVGDKLAVILSRALSWQSMAQRCSRFCKK